MFFEVLFLILLVFGLCVIAYRGAVHEFQILQKDYEPNQVWIDMMNEQLPIVIRDIPAHWIGNWSHSKTANKTWEILVSSPAEQSGKNKKFKTTWNTWLQTPNNTTPTSLQECATSIKLRNTFQHWQGEGWHQWYMLPVETPTPYVFQANNILGLRKGISDFSVIVASDGVPVELWIAHEGAIPDKVKHDILYKDPWTLTTKEVPWIGDVKYIEIKLRPGNAILIPRHWWYAVRSAQDDTSAPFSWFWKGDFHGPVSWLASLLGAPLREG
jgi:hypothetical protein